MIKRTTNKDSQLPQLNKRKGPRQQLDRKGFTLPQIGNSNFTLSSLEGSEINSLFDIWQIRL